MCEKTYHVDEKRRHHTIRENAQFEYRKTIAIIVNIREMNICEQIETDNSHDLKKREHSRNLFVISKMFLEPICYQHYASVPENKNKEA